MAATKRIAFRVHGTVQGVNFRYFGVRRSSYANVNEGMPSYFTQKKAIAYRLTGWVRNTVNEKVEGEAQGSEDGILSLLKDLNQGPTHAHVVKLEKQEMEVVENEEGFEIRH